MRLRAPRPNTLWLGVFGAWALFLSGAFASFVGSPGIIQAIRLKSLLSSKEAQTSRIRADIAKLQTENQQLEKNKAVQQREIRRVLGYAAPDELIFDFSSGEPI